MRVKYKGVKIEIFYRGVLFFDENKKKKKSKKYIFEGLI